MIPHHTSGMATAIIGISHMSIYSKQNMYSILYNMALTKLEHYEKKSIQHLYISYFHF